MTFGVARLNAADAAAVWPTVAPMIGLALDRGPGLYELGDVRDMVTQPESGTPFAPSLWVVGDGAGLLGAWTTEVRVLPRTKITIIAFAGGREMPRWYDLALAETEKFARECGCSRLHCEGRKGWAKLGYRPIGYWYERTIA